MYAKKRLIPSETVALANALAIEIGKRNFSRLWAIECGLHSGYPPCCVAFHTLFWSPASDDVEAVIEDDAEPTAASESYLDYLDALEKHPGFLGTGYIPCPACLIAGRTLTPKPCNCVTRSRKAQAAGKEPYPFRHDVTPGCVVFNGAERADADVTKTPTEATA